MRSLCASQSDTPHLKILAGNLAGRVAAGHETPKRVCSGRVFGRLLRFAGAEPARFRPIKWQRRSQDSVSIQHRASFSLTRKTGKPNLGGTISGTGLRDLHNRAQMRSILRAIPTVSSRGSARQPASQTSDGHYQIGQGARRQSKRAQTPATVSMSLPKTANGTPCRKELEATQNEVKSSMQTHRDQDLIIL